MRRVLAVSIWGGIFLLALFTFRHYHPTWAVAVVATGLLIGSYAIAVSLDASLIRRVRIRRGVIASLGSLLLTETILTVGVVVAIQVAYDLMWGPDPARFGFATNFATDFLGMNLFVFGARCVRRVSGLGTKTLAA